MARVLVVTNPFGGRAPGDRVTDPAEIDRILAGEHAHHVVQADHPAASASAAPAPAAPAAAS